MMLFKQNRCFAINFLALSHRKCIAVVKAVVLQK